MTDDSPKRDESAKPDAEPGVQPDADPLRLVLQTMEEQLDDRVGAVSSARPSHEESTSELIRLEETLSSAQDKAKQLVTLRLKLDEEASTERGPESASADSPEPSRPSSPAPVRPATHPDDREPPPPH